jgi:hypothetical protein
MDAGARRWRRSNFPNLTDHIAPHKDGIGISDAKVIFDASLQHRCTLSSRTNALWDDAMRPRGTHRIREGRWRAFGARSECRFAAILFAMRDVAAARQRALNTPATSNR